MSLFNEQKLLNLPAEQILAIALSHPAHQITLAVLTPQRICFFNENGEKLEHELSRQISACLITWHPTQLTLAIGWDTGLMTFWHDDTKVAKEEPNIHKNKIINVTYNPTGSRMVSCDDTGIIGVWRGINCISTYKRDDFITHFTFCELNLAEEKDKAMKMTKIFFFGGKAGVVCLADDANHCSEVCKVGGSIKSLLFYQKENSVIIITSTLLLVQFKISANEKRSPDKKAKLTIAGDPEQLQSIWIGNCLLATSSAENMLRMWHLEEDENYYLTLNQLETSDTQQINALMQDKIVQIQYEARSKVLVAGTKNGKALFWKNQLIGTGSPIDQDQWKMLPYIPISEEPISSICIGQSNSAIAFQSKSTILLIQETIVHGKMSSNIKVLQTSSKKMFLFDAKANIRGLDCTDQNLLIWTGKKIEIHEIISSTGLLLQKIDFLMINKEEAQTKITSGFSEKCYKVALYKDNIILIVDNGIKITNFKGVAKQEITFLESEGQPTNMSILGNFMVIYTSLNYIKIYDLSRRELKQIGQNRRFEDSNGLLGEIKSVSINIDGSKVGIISNKKSSANQQEFTASTCFYVYDVELDNFLKYDLGNNKTPLHFFWDQTDKRYFLVESIYSRVQSGEDDQQTEKQQQEEMRKNYAKIEDLEEEYKGKEIYTFFCTSEVGIKLQDSQKIGKEIEGVFALSVPKVLYIVRTYKSDPSISYKITEKTLNYFAGLDKIDEHSKKAIMDFSFFLAIGNMDGAYESVKSIQNPEIWEKMAQMCVKTKRLDVAEICIGNMRFGRGAKAVREAKKEEQLDAQLAMVAIQLGMKDQAKQLYEQCKRFDLTNKMYQASGEWELSVKIAEEHDRINLKNTYFKAAKLLEISREFEKAIIYFEKSGTYKKEVPRMLMNAGELKLLEDYIEEKKERDLYKWFIIENCDYLKRWAQYLESQGELEKCQKYYQYAEDYAAIVRLLLFQNDFEHAKKICLERADPSACYFLAKQLEANEQTQQAIQFYAKAQQYSHAVRIAKEFGQDDDIMSYSLQAPKQVMNSSAQYFEAKGFIEKAVILYMKAKNLKKALDLALKTKLYEYVDKITKEIDQKTDSKVLMKIEEVMVKNGQQSQAFHVVLAAKQTDQALNLLMENDIPITDEMIEQLLPPRNSKNPSDQAKRKELSQVLAQKARKQGNWGVAGKLFIELGDKVKAVKCLIKENDIQKVIAFATNARMPQIYILAGNYLQTCDWHTNPQIMKVIETFYSKAKSYESLANFYNACSQVEIDEYRDYDKALCAIKDSIKFAEKSQSPNRDQLLSMITQNKFLIEKFLGAKSLEKTNPHEMLEQCQQLIAIQNAESSIRLGDVFGLIINHYYETHQYKQAFQCIKQMQEKKIQLSLFLDKEQVQTIYEKLGKDNLIQQQPQQQQEAQFQEEIIDDDDDM